MHRVLDLFSGIGGFSLGLERTGGFRTVAFCEIDPFCRRVLKKNWPKVPCYDDVRTLTADRLSADGIGVDVICGGFPCQDISCAGKAAGLAGERSGLWSEIARLSSELRPRYIIVENVAALLGRGLDRVLGDLAEIGFDAEWHCIPASAVGAPHHRNRIWIVAHPDRAGLENGRQAGKQEGTRQAVWQMALTQSERRSSAWWEAEPDVGRVVAGISTRLDGGRLDADAPKSGTGEILRAVRDGVSAPHIQWPARGFGGLQAPKILLDVVCEHEGAARPLGHVSLASSEASPPVVRGVWFNGQTTCASCRRAAGKQRESQHPDPLRILPQLLACDCGAAWLDPTGTPSQTSRVDRLRALGNAVVPQIPELIGRAILAGEEMHAPS